jgi:hypothetical protein
VDERKRVHENEDHALCLAVLPGLGPPDDPDVMLQTNMYVRATVGGQWLLVDDVLPLCAVSLR